MTVADPGFNVWELVALLPDRAQVAQLAVLIVQAGQVDIPELATQVGMPVEAVGHAVRMLELVDVVRAGRGGWQVLVSPRQAEQARQAVTRMLDEATSPPRSAHRPRRGGWRRG